MCYYHYVIHVYTVLHSTYRPAATRLTWGLGDRGSKTGKVDESVGHEEEGGDDLSNLVQLSYSSIRVNEKFTDSSIRVNEKFTDSSIRVNEKIH